MEKPKKKRVLIVSLVVLLLLILVNWYISTQIKEAFSTGMDEASEELNIEISYDKISSMPILSTVTVHNLTYIDLDTDMSILIDTLRVKLPYKETFSFFESEDGYLYPFTLKAENAVIGDDDLSILVDNMTAKYDGVLNLEEIEETIMANNQYLKLTYDNMRMNFSEDYIVTSELDPEFFFNLPALDSVNLEVFYDADKDRIDIKECSINNEYFNFDIIDYSFSYDNSADEPLVIISGDVNSSFSTNGKEFGSLENYGLLSVGVFTMNSTVRNTISLGEECSDADNLYNVFSYLFDYSNRYWEEDDLDSYQEFFPLNPQYHNEIRVEIKDFSAQAGQNFFSEFQNPLILVDSLPGLTIDHFTLDCLMTEKSMTVDAQLESPLISADIIADIESSNEIFDNNTNINQARLIIKELSPELEMILAYIEADMGKPFVRENGNIILEIEGDINNPRLKGMDSF